MKSNEWSKRTKPIKITTKAVTMQYTLIIHCIHKMDGFGIGISPGPKPYLEAQINFLGTVCFKQLVLCLVLRLEKVWRHFTHKLFR